MNRNPADRWRTLGIGGQTQRTLAAGRKDQLAQYGLSILSEHFERGSVEQEPQRKAVVGEAQRRFVPTGEAGVKSGATRSRAIHHKLAARRVEDNGSLLFRSG